MDQNFNHRRNYVLMLKQNKIQAGPLLVSSNKQSVHGEDENIKFECQSYSTSYGSIIIEKLSLLLSSPMTHVMLSMGVIVGLPVVLFNHNSGVRFSDFLWAIINAWDGLLRTSMILVAGITLLTSIYVSQKMHKKYAHDDQILQKKQQLGGDVSSISAYSYATAMIVFIFMANIVVVPQLQLIAPGWVWNPFLWGTYKIYYPKEVSKAIKGLCLDYSFGESSDREPLCLSESSWTSLSAGALSSRDDNDVAAVLKGIDYIQHQSGGMVVNIMCRDCIDDIPALKDNIENMRWFFPTMSVVVFENDSNDGSREAFQLWAKESKGYKVDLMDCEDAPNCRFGISHRYDSFEAKDYFKSSAIGKMDKFRQQMVDYITSNPYYDSYSHMLVLDLDLGVSISPLGVLHSIGEVPDYAVASSGRQTWPGSLGTLVPPYDFSAFRSYPSKKNQHLLMMDNLFCGLTPAGDRWRNMCDATSPTHMIQVLDVDRGSRDIYRVQSAFNGATLYPLRLIREAPQAKYDTGIDGQRCEHIGFNLSLQKPMFVDRKWTFNIAPGQPGGPSGNRALKNILMVTFTPSLGLVMFLQGLICYTLFVTSVMQIGSMIIYPLFFKHWIATIVQPSTISSARRTTLPIFVPSSSGNTKTANMKV